MANWKTYGADVIVSAGVLITGLLWYERPSPFIAGEDMAELLAATNEREWAFVHDYDYTNAAVYNASTVTCFITKANLQTILDGARDPFAVNSSDVSFNGDYVFFTHGKIPGDGEAVAWTSGQWVIDYIVTNSIPRTAATYMRYWKWDAAFKNGSESGILALATRHHSATTVKTALHTYGVFSVTNLPPNKILFGTDKALAGNESYYFGGTGNWWTAKGYGTNLYVFGGTNKAEDITDGGTVTLRPHSIRTNTLNAVRNIFAACTQSVYVCEGVPGSGSVIKTIGNGAYSRAKSGNGIVVSYMVTQAKADAVANAETTTNQISHATAASLRSELAAAYLNVHVAGESPWEGYSTGWGASAGMWFHEVAYTNMTLAYPASAACSSGLVSRVRVYFLCRRYVQYPFSPAFRCYTWSGYTHNPAAGYSVTVSSYPWAISDYNAYDLGTGVALAAMPTNTWICTQNICDLPSTSETLEKPVSTWYWTLVHDVFNPTSAVTYSWAPETPNVPRDVNYVQWGSTESVQPSVTYDNIYYVFDHAIICDYSMTVVDWNWKHLGSAPFEPATNTPTWIIANTNSL